MNEILRFMQKRDERTDGQTDGRKAFYNLFHAFLKHFYEEICTSSLPIIDEFLPSVLSVSPGSDSTDALVSWFCVNSPQSVYKLAKSRSRVNTDMVQ